MVLRHFNLREQPFGVTPDPRFLYASATHREALAALLYGLESGLGFVSLIANPGMGKTTILFEALGRLGDTARTVFLFQSIQTPLDLFRALLIDLGEKNPQGSVVDLETRLNEILLEQSKTGKKPYACCPTSKPLAGNWSRSFFADSCNSATSSTDHSFCSFASGSRSLPVSTRFRQPKLLTTFSIGSKSRATRALNRCSLSVR
jgi:hypothetical protein